MVHLPAFAAAMNNGPMSQKVTEQWAKMWLAYIKRRFNIYSRGGGDWKPLAASTIKARRSSRGSNARTRGQQIARLRKQFARAGLVKADALHRKINALASGEGTSILVNTGVMRKALDLGAPGNLFQPLGNGTTRVGFAGVIGHANGKATIAQIASWHNRGGAGGRPPKRQILVPPDQALVTAMANVQAREMQALLRGPLVPGPSTP